MIRRNLLRVLVAAALLVLANSLGAQQPITQGLVAHFKFDESSGTAALDSSPTGNNGVYAHDIPSGTGPQPSIDKPVIQPDNAYSRTFDGLDDMITVPSAAYSPVKTNFTISFWARPEVTRSQRTQSSSGTDGDTQLVYWGYALSPRDETATYGANNATAGVAVGTNGVSVCERGTSYSPQTLVDTTPVNGWTHIAVVYNDNRPTLYLHGTLVKSGDKGPMTVHPACNMGPIPGAVTGAYKGGLDDVRIYNRALSDAEIHELGIGNTTADYGPPMTSVLSTSAVTKRSITVGWLAPASDNTGDTASSGASSQYDLRISTAAITDANFNLATAVTGLGSPKSIGLSESVPVGSLRPNTRYYFALKTADELGQWSALSTPVNEITLNDTVKPGMVTDLALTSVEGVSAHLQWTAPADDGVDVASGAAAAYDLRYSTAGPIDSDAAFAAATPAPLPFTPHAPGSVERAVIEGLGQNGTYYFALKVGDFEPNWSVVSNSVSTGALFGGSLGVSSPCAGSASGTTGLLLLPLLAAGLLRRNR